MYALQHCIKLGYARYLVNVIASLYPRMKIVTTLEKVQHFNSNRSELNTDV